MQSQGYGRSRRVGRHHVITAGGNLQRSSSLSPYIAN